MRLHRLRFEFRMELAAQIPRMICNFADLDINPIRRFPGYPQTRACQDLLVFPIEFVAVTVPLTDFICLVSLLREAALAKHTGPRAQTHRAAQFVHAFQLAQFVNHPMRRAGVELSGVGPF